MIWYVTCLAAGSFVSNLATYIYTKNTFDTNQSIYYILALDSGMTSISSLVYLLIYVYQEFLSSNGFICSIFMFSMLVPFTTFPVLNFLTSYIKYKKIEASMLIKTWISEKTIIKKTKVTMCACLIFALAEVTGNAVMNLQMSPMYSDCMNQMNQSTNSFVFVILNVVPANIVILITAAYDIKSLLHVRKFRRTSPSTSNEQRTLMQETPFRSSIINLVCVIAGFVLSSVFLDNDDNDTNLEAKWSKVASMVFLHLMLKNPLIVLWTVRVYQANMHINQSEEKERKRQIEIKEAQKRRREIEAKRESQPANFMEMSESSHESAEASRP